MITLVRVVETCRACPAQWDAWDTEGRYYYLRYRFGQGTVDTYANPDPETWDGVEGGVAQFADPDEPMRGTIELTEFLHRAALRLAPDAEVVAYAPTS
ncbi:hypothetical protein [Streptomyces silvensis]|uniref:Uncharacterized protein n=1 Tax=Streptomyces silvensis TaxID=1765722 RepID=A0A0W7X786_9ACTN|nr:hypothetical protein [Streptomyces silvensis]KUF18451.1 hypothetical protein AT728_19080 [Streptomyces silvensis]